MTTSIANQTIVKSQAQVTRLVAYMKKNQTITPLEAWRDLGIYRLAARVYDLRNKGIVVRGAFITVNDQFGKPCRVMSYSMGITA